MVAKMAGEQRESLSADDKRDLLQASLIDQYGVTPEANPDPTGLSISEVYDDYLIYRIGEQLYKTNYALAEDGSATFTGDPEKVTRSTVYTPMESLQAKYAEIIQEAGRRNATLDSSRIKKIVELCQELLSSDLPDGELVKKATKEAVTALSWLQEQPLTKTEDGEKFPADGFAYVPDADNPDTWKLRMTESIDKGVTKPQLNKIAASLSPGGYKGQKANIPESSRPDVMRRIRMGYRTLGIGDDEMSQWVKGAETREAVLTYTPLTEAKFDKGRATVIVIKPGFNATEDRYYPKEMLRRDFKVFEGMKMYADHPTSSEEKELPERSMKSTGFVARLMDVTCDENGTVTGVADIIEDWLMRKLANMRDKQMLSEMGISINALGRGSKSTIEGVETMVIEQITGARSVDFVTEPGASGIVTLYESDRDTDVDLIELQALKERRPDLVKALESAVREEVSKEVKHAMELEERVKELEGQVTTVTTERDELQGKITEAEKERAKAEAQASIKEAVDKAELPSAAKERLLERYKDTETAEGIAEAIKSEVDYIAKLSEAGKVKGLGGSTPNPEKDTNALRESVKKLHPEYTDAQVETFVTRR